MWLVAAAGWLLIWRVGFTPRAEGDWGRGVERLLRSAHDVRVALVFAVPAALVAYDLLRGWIQQQRIQSPRSGAARSRDRAADPVTHASPTPELVINVRDGRPQERPETPVAPRGAR